MSTEGATPGTDGEDGDAKQGKQRRMQVHNKKLLAFSRLCPFQNELLSRMLALS